MVVNRGQKVDVVLRCSMNEGLENRKGSDEDVSCYRSCSMDVLEGHLEGQQARPRMQRCDWRSGMSG